MLEPASPIITQRCRKSSMSCARPSTAKPANPPHSARSIGRRLRHNDAIRNENVISAGSPIVAAMLIGVQCESKGAPWYSPGLVPSPLPNRGFRTTVASADNAACLRLESTCSKPISNGRTGLISGFQIVIAIVTAATLTAPIAATARRRGVVALRIRTANTKPNIPREKVNRTVTHKHAKAPRRTHFDSSARLLETIAAAKIQKLARRLGL